MEPNGNNAEAQLLESALSLFSEKGYERTSVREIIERAQVSRPVLYYYFKSKEDLFCSLVESMQSEMMQRIDGMLEGVEGARNRLKAMIRYAFTGAEEHPDKLRLILQVAFSPDQKNLSAEAQRLGHLRFQKIAAIIREGLEEGELSGGEPEALALMFSGLMDIHVMASMNQPEGHLTPQMADALVDLFFEGVGNHTDKDVFLETSFDFNPDSVALRTESNT